MRIAFPIRLSAHVTLSGRVHEAMVSRQCAGSFEHDVRICGGLPHWVFPSRHGRVCGLDEGAAGSAAWGDDDDEEDDAGTAVLLLCTAEGVGWDEECDGDRLSRSGSRIFAMLARLLRRPLVAGSTFGSRHSSSATAWAPEIKFLSTGGGGSTTAV